MSALLTSDIMPMAKHGFDDVTVADFRAKDLASMGCKCLVESEVAHNCGYKGIPLKAPAAQEVHCGDRHDFVSVHEFAIFVAEQHTVGIPVVGDAYMGLGFRDQ
jgi:hypothetical protein